MRPALCRCSRMYRLRSRTKIWVTLVAQTEPSGTFRPRMNVMKLANPDDSSFALSMFSARMARLPAHRHVEPVIAESLLIQALAPTSKVDFGSSHPIISLERLDRQFVLRSSFYAVRSTQVVLRSSFYAVRSTQFVLRSSFYAVRSTMRSTFPIPWLLFLCRESL